MLSVFPTLFSYGLLVPFVFRIVVGIFFVLSGYKNITKKRELKIALLSRSNSSSRELWLWVISSLEIVGGLFMTVGLYTQVVALIFSAVLLLATVNKRKNPEVAALSEGTLLLLLLISASLLFLGPGFYAFDFPL